MTLVTAALAPVAVGGCGPRRGGPSRPSADAPAATASVVIPWGPAAFTQKASAPAGIDGRFLGVPLDVRFSPFAGQEGASLFAGARVDRAVARRVDLHTDYVDDTLAFEAEARAWGVPTTEAAATSGNRYASYVIYTIEYVDTLDDRHPSRYAPSGTFAYPYKIYWGRAFEAVFHGPESAFHGGVRARLTTAQGEMRSFARKEHIDLDTHARGLRPKSGEPTFAASAGQIGEQWVDDGPVVPIFVEYHGAPGAQPHTQPIRWVRSFRIDAQYTQVRVGNRGTGAAEPKWTLEGGCEVNGQPATNVVNVLDATKVADGQVLPLTWRMALPGVGPTDVVTCGTDGHLEDRGATFSLAKGRTPPIAIRLGPPQAGEFFAGDAKAGYAIGYSVTVSENP
jgi:hypothetical protein